MMNINIYYFPDYDYNYDEISQVNGEKSRVVISIILYLLTS